MIDSWWNHQKQSQHRHQHVDLRSKKWVVTNRNEYLTVNDETNSHGSHRSAWNLSNKICGLNHEMINEKDFIIKTVLVKPRKIPHELHYKLGYPPHQCQRIVIGWWWSWLIVFASAANRATSARTWAQAQPQLPWRNPHVSLFHSHLSW